MLISIALQFQVEVPGCSEKRERERPQDAVVYVSSECKERQDLQSLLANIHFYIYSYSLSRRHAWSPRPRWTSIIENLSRLHWTGFCRHEWSSLLSWH